MTTLRHPALGAAATVARGLTELVSANLWSVSGGDLLALRAELEAAQSMLTAAKLMSTREIDGRGAATSAGATSTTAWLTGVLHLPAVEARREVVLADQVVDLPATREALAAGALPSSAVPVLVTTDRALARVATAPERIQAEAILVEQASLLDHRGLQVTALHLRHLLDPDQGRQVEEDELRQREGRAFRLQAQPDGSARASGSFDKESVATLRAALDPLTRPRPATGEALDRRDHPRRMADALVELAERAVRTTGTGDEAPGSGTPAQVVVTIGWDDLRRQTLRARAGELDLGLPLSVAAVRRLACDARVLPVVLGSAGQPLDVGRLTRAVPAGLRRALEERDKGCSFPGCDRPRRWCDAHHVHHWADGGPTALDNLVLLCGHHHRTVHHARWSVAVAEDGFPEFRPPPWLDPDQTPRRNPRATCGRPPSPP